MPHPPRLRAFLVVGALSALTVSGCSRRAPSPPETPAGEARPAPSSAATRLTVTQVRAELASLLEAAPNDPATMVEMALLDLRTGDIAAAERELSDCSRRFPRYPRASFQLGMLYLEHGRELAAVAPLKAAAALTRDDAAVAENTALACFRTGRIDEAKQYARMALKIDDRFADTYLVLARIYDAHGTSAEALQYVESYLRYSANPAPGYYLMGRIYARQASRDKAEQWLRKAVEAEPSNAEFWVALGRVCYELFNATKAQEGMRCYERALEADPKNSSAHRYMGHALLDQRRFAEAITHLQAALPQADDPGPVLYDLGQAMVKSGRVEEGKRALDLYRQHQEYASGAQKLMDAVSAMPGDRRRHYSLIKYCLDRGRYSAAMAAIEGFRAKFGDDATVRALADRAEQGAGTPRGGEAAMPSPNAGPSVQEPGIGRRNPFAP